MLDGVYLLSLVHMYRLFPPFVFGEALLALTNMWYSNEMGGGNANPSDWEVAGRA